MKPFRSRIQSSVAAGWRAETSSITEGPIIFQLPKQLSAVLSAFLRRSLCLSANPVSINKGFDMRLFLVALLVCGLAAPATAQTASRHYQRQLAKQRGKALVAARAAQKKAVEAEKVEARERTTSPMPQPNRIAGNKCSAPRSRPESCCSASCWD